MAAMVRKAVMPARMLAAENMIGRIKNMKGLADPPV
jgi:hypothetical protein